MDHVQHVPLHPAHHGHEHPVVGILLQVADELDPVHAGHVEVGQQQIDALELLQLVQGILAIMGNVDLAEPQLL